MNGKGQRERIIGSQKLLEQNGKGYKKKIKGGAHF